MWIPKGERSSYARDLAYLAGAWFAAGVVSGLAIAGAVIAGGTQ